VLFYVFDYSLPLHYSLPMDYRIGLAIIARNRIAISLDKFIADEYEEGNLNKEFIEYYLKILREIYS
jgi:hypothetical protein